MKVIASAFVALIAMSTAAFAADCCKDCCKDMPQTQTQSDHQH